MSRSTEENSAGKRPNRAAAVARDSAWPVAAAIVGAVAGLVIGAPALVGAGVAGVVLFPVINWIKSGRSQP